MSSPAVSVVMAVYNGAATLPKSLKSILDQQDVDLEFIVVNDGSTDDTGRVLDEEAEKDPRLVIVHQSNTGLTKALIAGCALATAPYLARQDCGDESAPNRLRAQLDLLEKFPEYVAVTCHTAFHGPADEPMYVSKISGADLKEGLRAPRYKELKGPSSHPSVVMRADAYRRVGGYRAQFYYSQDIDLWTRISELGDFGVVPLVLYKARYEESGISNLHRKHQVALSKIIWKCQQARSARLDESQLLAAASRIGPWIQMGTARQKKMARVAGLYFIASCISRTDRGSALKYCWRALALAPWHLRSRILAWRLTR